MEPIVIKRFLEPADFSSVLRLVTARALSLEGREPADRRFFRHFTRDEPGLVELHRGLIPRIGAILGKPIEKSYVFLSMYGPEGDCPRHTDRPSCRYTLSLCVSQKKIWPFFVDEVAYELDVNDALLYSGTDSVHSREKIDPDNFCNMVLFHFVDADPPR